MSLGVFKGERSLRDILEIGLKTVSENVYPGLESITLVAWTEEEQKELTSIFDQLLV